MANCKTLQLRAETLLKKIPTGSEGKLTRSGNARHGLEIFVILSELNSREESRYSKIAIDEIIHLLAQKPGWLSNFLAIFKIVFDGESYKQDTVRKLCNGLSIFTGSDQGLEFAERYKDDICGINSFLRGWFPKSGICITIPGYSISNKNFQLSD